MPLDGVARISDPAAVRDMVAMATIAGAGHTAELFRAAQIGTIALAGVSDRQSFFTGRELKTLRAPAIAWVPADDGGPDRPHEWACADTLRRWCRFAVIHGTGGTVSDYRKIIGLAKQWRRLLLVECSSDAVPAWIAFMKGAPQVPKPQLLAWLPRPGTVHPAPPDADDLKTQGK
jgi:hypothetical protein